MRQKERHQSAPSTNIVHTYTKNTTTTISKKTKSFNTEKKINNHKTFKIVDTLLLLITLVVVAASISDNVGGINVADRALERSARFAKL